MGTSAACRGERTHAETLKPSDCNTSAGALAIIPKPRKRHLREPLRAYNRIAVVTSCRMSHTELPGQVSPGMVRWWESVVYASGTKCGDYSEGGSREVDQLSIDMARAKAAIETTLSGCADLWRVPVSARTCESDPTGWVGDGRPQVNANVCEESQRPRQRAIPHIAPTFGSATN